LKRSELKTEEAILIDDRQKNIDGGEKVGIKSLLFTTTSQLIDDIKKLGLKF